MTSQSEKITIYEDAAPIRAHAGGEFAAIMAAVIDAEGRKVHVKILSGPSAIVENSPFMRPTEITSLIEVEASGRTLFRIRPDGSSECADGYSIDAGARAFGEAVAEVLKPVIASLMQPA